MGSLGAEEVVLEEEDGAVVSTTTTVSISVAEGVLVLALGEKPITAQTVTSTSTEAAADSHSAILEPVDIPFGRAGGAA